MLQHGSIVWAQLIAFTNMLVLYTSVIIIKLVSKRNLWKILQILYLNCKWEEYWSNYVIEKGGDWIIFAKQTGPIRTIYHISHKTSNKLLKAPQTFKGLKLVQCPNIVDYEQDCSWYKWCNISNTDHFDSTSIVKLVCDEDINFQDGYEV